MCVLHVCEQLPESLVLHRDPADTHGDEGETPESNPPIRSSDPSWHVLFPAQKKKMISLVLVTRACPKCVSWRQREALLDSGVPPRQGSPGARGASGHRGRRGFVMCKAGSERWETRGGDSECLGMQCWTRMGYVKRRGGSDSSWGLLVAGGVGGRRMRDRNTL